MTFSRKISLQRIARRSGFDTVVLDIRFILSCRLVRPHCLSFRFILLGRFGL